LEKRRLAPKSARRRRLASRCCYPSLPPAGSVCPTRAILRSWLRFPHRSSPPAPSTCAPIAPNRRLPAPFSSSDHASFAYALKRRCRSG
jgi:hypothetical protein